jgi:RNA polymerase primary sigma factor
MIIFDSTIKEYLTEIDESPLLTWQQECELANQIIEHNDPQARDQMVRSNLRLVVSIAKRFTLGRLALADLIEEGNLGLIRAIDSFDPSVGVRFSTYAAWWIKQTIKRALLLDSGPISVPTYMVELINQYRQVLADLQTRCADNPIPPTPAQIAEEMKLPVKKIMAIKEIIDSTNTPLHRNNTCRFKNTSRRRTDRNRRTPKSRQNAQQARKKRSRNTQTPLWNQQYRTVDIKADRC